VVENARKVSFGAVDLTNVLGKTKRVYAARGKRVVEFDLAEDSLSSDIVRKSLLGPTGKLRAPAIRIGGSFIVGFNQELYVKVLHQ
jgi:hypothetical protein